MEYENSSKRKNCIFHDIFQKGRGQGVREACQKKNSENNEFGTICLWTPPPTINSEKSNSENWSQSVYPPSLKK